MIAHVLVVDDEPVVLELTRAILQSRAHRVDVATTGDEALELLGEREYDLAVIDYGLSSMDGFDLASRSLRSRSRRAERPVLLAAVEGDAAAIRRQADALFAHVLTKPLEPTALLEAVDSALVHRRERLDELADAGAALGRQGDADASAAASRAMWRAQGFARRPRVAVFPAPTPEQAEAFEVCFDLAGPAAADLVVVTDASDMRAAWAALGEGAALLPVVDVNGLRHPAFDLSFAVRDRRGWAEVVEAAAGYAARGRRLSARVRSSSDPADRLLSYMSVRERPFSADALGALGLAPVADTHAAVDRLLARGFLTIPDWAVGRSGLTLTDAARAWLAAPAPPLQEDGDVPARLAERGAEASLATLNRLLHESARTLAEAGLKPPEGQPDEDGLASPVSPAEARRPADDRARGGEVTALPRAKVLLVEPLEFSREIVRSVLEARRYRVEAVADGAGMMKAVRSRDWDLVLVSLALADIEALSSPSRVARAMKGAAAPPLVGLASTGPVQEEGALAAGFVAFLPRNVRPGELVDIVDGVIARTKAEPPLQDRAAFDELTALIGLEAAEGLSGKLVGQLRRAFAHGSDRPRLALDAAGMASAAGALGYRRLALACERLEAECSGDGSTDAALAAVQAARSEVLAQHGRDDTAGSSLLRSVEVPGLEVVPTAARPTIVR